MPLLAGGLRPIAHRAHRLNNGYILNSENPILTMGSTLVTTSENLFMAAILMLAGALIILLATFSLVASMVIGSLVTALVAGYSAQKLDKLIGLRAWLMSKIGRF